MDFTFTDRHSRRLMPGGRPSSQQARPGQRGNVRTRRRAFSDDRVEVQFKDTSDLPEYIAARIPLRNYNRLFGKQNRGKTTRSTVRSVLRRIWYTENCVTINPFCVTCDEELEQISGSRHLSDYGFRKLLDEHLVETPKVAEVQTVLPFTTADFPPLATTCPQLMGGVYDTPPPASSSTSASVSGTSTSSGKPNFSGHCVPYLSKHSLALLNRKWT
jgi:hypothetical protein